MEAELDCLQADGVIEPVKFAEWAAPVAPVIKGNGTIQICGEYKLTVNQVATVDSYPLPLPRIEDLIAPLSGGVVFSKLDLTHAYQQLELEESSRRFVTINTHKGLFRYTRLPFGIASAPAIFQQTMEPLLQGIAHICVYIDNILVTGKSEADHLQRLEQVLERLEKAGMKLKRSKCRFMLPEVEYLGHRINKQGLQPTEDKAKAIRDALHPKAVSELKAAQGFNQLLCQVLPNLASTLAPLHQLLRKNTQWTWGKDQDAAFNAAKDSLAYWHISIPRKNWF